MVWLHTARAGKYIELRHLGQAIWNEMKRGFPFIESAAAFNLQTRELILEQLVSFYSRLSLSLDAS